MVENLVDKKKKNVSKGIQTLYPIKTLVHKNLVSSKLGELLV